MLIDRTHRGWALATTGVLAGSAGLYAWSRAGAVRPFSGGSAIGLGFGIAGFALMVFAALLPARRKVPAWRIGRAQTWMRGHLWLGTLSVALIFLHGGLGFGGGLLTRVLMFLLALVGLSGLIGAALQHVVPRVMTDRVPMETIYEQIDHVRRQLVEEADLIVATSLGVKPPANPHATGAERAAEVLKAIQEMQPASPMPMRDFHLSQLRPYLADGRIPNPLSDSAASQQAFAWLRTVVAEKGRAAADDLESICEEQQQLGKQHRLHLLLHTWLFVHAPLSFALLALVIVHIVMALRY